VFPEETHPNYKSIKHNAERIFGVWLINPE
jgi:hypothetical protein